jgi:hypothetical protein
MSRWEPDIDLMRLLEALANEIVSTTELEVRQACAEGGRSMAGTANLVGSAWPELKVEGQSSIARSAEEVRDLIDAVTGDQGDPDEQEIDVAKDHIELGNSRHLHRVIKPGSRTCHKQH